MIVVTGHSDKFEGVCFVADTDDKETALAMMRDAWNTQFTDKVKLITTEFGDYLIRSEYSDECVNHFEDETPRYEGFALYANKAPTDGGIIQRMPW